MAARGIKQRTGLSAFGKAARTPPAPEPVPITIGSESWWTVKQQESRVAFNQYRESRLLRSDGKIALFERFE